MRCCSRTWTLRASSGNERLDTSLQDFVGNRAYDISQLRTDLDRFVFLLDGDNTGHLFDPPQQQPTLTTRAAGSMIP
jgi:hypothetical protein